MKPTLKLFLSAFMLLVLAAAVVIPAAAQSELTLRVNKDFGYNTGRNIRGTFTLSASGPEDLAEVIFLIDGLEIGRASEAPFELQIKTDDYPAGDHTLLARGILASGSQVESPVRSFRFVTREEEASGMQNILVPLLGVIALITVGGFALQMLSARGARSRPVTGPVRHTYRGGRGAICPRCGMPTPVHITGLNMGFFTKFDRCEACGKWSFMRVRSAQELEAYADSLEVQNQPHVPAESEEEKLRRQVDESRFSE